MLKYYSIIVLRFKDTNKSKFSNKIGILDFLIPNFLT